MIFECPMEGFFISVGAVSYHLSPSFSKGTELVYLTRTCPKNGGTIKNGSIDKEQFDNEVGFRFTPVYDESTLARLMMLGLE